jgi:hypothetical protein
MASSTSSPIAIASPPSVIVLIDTPSHRNTRMAVRIDSGIAASEISVIRQLPRNSSTTTATTHAAAASLT